MEDTKTALKATPFSSTDVARGEDGELYHLPTLRALFAAGRLSPGSEGHLVLLQHGGLQTGRMIA
ncbi:hypothetical protein [Deinococcus hopiensis]|uniref:Uncharacterized protein n=1 Tax=Deinococcus hopiensis KR-140 TaxID=695939 RepID=A0A1W1V9Q4_9DEIO|nr:hypothetical protein [Deinococcus hopiensis]SMB90068.1 hypothetical protein SAMN00790413_00638 [Deinococcus hopiensis KR-140]